MVIEMFKQAMGRLENLFHTYSYPEYRDRLVSERQVMQLRKRLETQELNEFEINTLADYERPYIYRAFEGGRRVLNIASSNDGIPVCVYGGDRVINLDILRTRRRGYPTIQADMYRTPVAKESVGTILVHNMNIFTSSVMHPTILEESVRKGLVNPLSEFFGEMARIADSDAKMIITQVGKRRENPDEDVFKRIEDQGWKLVEKGESNVLSHYVFERN